MGHAAPPSCGVRSAAALVTATACFLVVALSFAPPQPAAVAAATFAGSFGWRLARSGGDGGDGAPPLLLARVPGAYAPGDPINYDGERVVKPPTFAPLSSSLAGAFPAAKVAAQPWHRSILASDVFLVDACVKVVSCTECGWEVDLSLLRVEVVGSATAPAAVAPAAPLSLLRVRTLWEWSTVGELCRPALTAAADVRVVLHFGGVASPELHLARVPPAPPADDVAMVAMLRSDVVVLPLWLDYWAALGVAHFYLYYNAELSEALALQPSIVNGLVADARVTLVEWDVHPMWQTGAYAEFGSVPCTGHFAQLQAYNSAWHRYRSAHAFMGFFDLDEFGVVPGGAAALARGASPLSTVLVPSSSPHVVTVLHAWGALQPPPAAGERLTLASLAPGGAHAVYGSGTLPPHVRNKFFVSRNASAFEDWMVGNHDVFPLRTARTAGSGTRVITGHGYENNNALRRGVDTAGMYFLHIFNLRRKHQSRLPFREADMLAEMRANNSRASDFEAVAAAAVDGARGFGSARR